MTKEEFNKMIEVGDIVTIIGLKEPVDCVVMTKTEYACNLFTVEQGNTADGIMRPRASYYRSYDEIIAKVSSNHTLYKQYLDLIEYDKTHPDIEVTTDFVEQEQGETKVQANERTKHTWAALLVLKQLNEETFNMLCEKASENLKELYEGSEIYETRPHCYSVEYVPGSKEMTEAIDLFKHKGITFATVGLDELNGLTSACAVLIELNNDRTHGKSLHDDEDIERFFWPEHFYPCEALSGVDIVCEDIKEGTLSQHYKEDTEQEYWDKRMGRYLCNTTK
jgi:hypothetical protein